MAGTITMTCDEYGALIARHEKELARFEAIELAARHLVDTVGMRIGDRVSVLEMSPGAWNALVDALSGINETPTA